MFLLGFSLCLAIVHGIVPDITKTDMDIIANMETNVEEGQTTLSDMFKEVEELMEDTQQKLEDAGAIRFFALKYSPIIVLH